MEWKQKIFKLRQDLKLTQVELAKNLGVSKRLIIYWEKGEKTPSRAMQDALSRLEKEALHDRLPKGELEGEPKGEPQGEPIKGELKGEPEGELQGEPVGEPKGELKKAKKKRERQGKRGGRVRQYRSQSFSIRIPYLNICDILTEKGNLNSSSRVVNLALGHLFREFSRDDIPEAIRNNPELMMLKETFRKCAAQELSFKDDGKVSEKGGE